MVLQASSNLHRTESRAFSKFTDFTTTSMAQKGGSFAPVETPVATVPKPTVHLPAFASRVLLLNHQAAPGEHTCRGCELRSCRELLARSNKPWRFQTCRSLSCPSRACSAVNSLQMELKCHSLGPLSLGLKAFRPTVDVRLRCAYSRKRPRPWG